VIKQEEPPYDFKIHLFLDNDPKNEIEFAERRDLEDKIKGKL